MEKNKVMTQGFSQDSYLQKDGLLDSLIAKHQDAINNVALYLSGGEENIPQVMEEVFVRLYRELGQNTGESVDEIIHRLAYEVSLEIFMSQIQEPKSEEEILYGDAYSDMYDELREELNSISDEDIEQCQLLFESKAAIDEIADRIEESSYMINCITKKGLKN